MPGLTDANLGMTVTNASAQRDVVQGSGDLAPSSTCFGSGGAGHLAGDQVA